MIRKFRSFENRRVLIFPIVWKSLLKIAAAVIITMLWNRFVNGRGLAEPVSYVFPAMGAVYLLLAWTGFLRFDSVHIPRIFSGRKKKDSRQNPGGFADRLDSEPETDEDLSQDERDFCAVVSWLAAALVCIAAAIISGGLHF